MLIGFIGTGHMGRPMITHLHAAGHTLQVYARRPESIAHLAQTRLHLVNSPAEAAQDAAVTFTNVTTTEDVIQVVLGENGIINRAGPGSTVIDMSTISAKATQSIASRLAEKQIDMLDAPVSGGVKGAQDATLSIMVGGSVDVLERVRPLLSCLGKTIVYIGDHGAGQIAKACNQIVQVINIAGIAEAMHFANHFHVDLHAVLQAISAGMAGSKMLDLMGPKMANRQFNAGIEARLHDKDFQLITALAHEQDLVLPTIECVGTQLRQLIARGWGYDDTSSLLRVLEAHSQSHPEEH